MGSGLALVAVTLFGLADAVPLGAKIGILQWAAAGLILAAHHVHAGLAGSATINHQDFTLPCPR